MKSVQQKLGRVNSREEVDEHAREESKHKKAQEESKNRKAQVKSTIKQPRSKSGPSNLSPKNFHPKALEKSDSVEGP